MTHRSVLLDEVLGYIDPWQSEEKKYMWDATLGLAGHSIAALSAHKNLQVLGSDCDSEMLALAEKKITEAGVSERVVLKNANFSENPFAQMIPGAGLDYILADLGISSLHLDSFSRGITYRYDQPLDMRLDMHRSQPVSDWLNKASYEELKHCLYNYGEEKKAPLIARKIINAREEQPLKTTLQLKAIVESCFKKHTNRKKTHTERNPSARTFQALRIKANNELQHLETALHFMPTLLKPGGKLLMISFHSLEDRLVKHSFKKLEKIKNTSPLAKSEYREGNFTMLTKKPVTPANDEIDQNPRSRSAKLRVLQKKPVMP